MPTYEYECKSCAYTFEVFQAMSDAPLTECPKCGKEIRRLILGGAGVIFKGSGFYVTDKGKGAASGAPAKAAKTAAGSTEPGTASDGAAANSPKEGAASREGSPALEGGAKKSEAASAAPGGASSETQKKAPASKSA